MAGTRSALNVINAFKNKSKTSPSKKNGNSPNRRKAKARAMGFWGSKRKLLPDLEMTSKASTLSHAEATDLAECHGSLCTEDVHGLHTIFEEWQNESSPANMLTRDDLEAAFQADERLCLLVSKMHDIFDEVDADASDSIDFQEFLSLVNDRLPYNHQKGENEDPRALLTAALVSVGDEMAAVFGGGTMSEMEQLMRREEKVLLSRKCFFAPDRDTVLPNHVFQFKTSWDILQVIMLIYVGLAIPVRMSFHHDDSFAVGSAMWTLEAVIDLLFIVDLILNFRTAYRDQDGTLHYNYNEIMWHYLKGWFIIDLIACLPVSYLGLLVNSEYGGEVGSRLKVLKITRLLRLTKMLRLRNMLKLITRLNEEYPGVMPTSKLSAMVIVICFISHIVACGWYWVGTGSNTLESGEVLEGWARRRHWLPTDNVTLYTRYLDSYYYAVTTLTTVGYGDRVPHSNNEKLFSIITELAGGLVFGILTGTLSAMVLTQSAAATRAKQELSELREFMLCKGISKQLRVKITEDMEEIWRRKTVFNEEKILVALPAKHRRELLMTMYRDNIKACPLFSGLGAQSDEIVSKLCVKLRPYTALKEEQIHIEGEVHDEMYMIVKGEVKMSSKSCPDIDGTMWSGGGYFGELNMLQMGNGPFGRQAWYTAEAVDACDLCYLEQKQLDDMRDDFPDLYRKVQHLAKKRARRFAIPLRLARKGKAVDEGRRSPFLSEMRTRRTASRPLFPLTPHDLGLEKVSKATSSMVYEGRVGATAVFGPDGSHAPGTMPSRLASMLRRGAAAGRANPNNNFGEQNPTSPGLQPPETTPDFRVGGGGAVQKAVPADFMQSVDFSRRPGDPVEDLTELVHDMHRTQLIILNKLLALEGQGNMHGVASSLQAPAAKQAPVEDDVGGTGGSPEPDPAGGTRPLPTPCGTTSGLQIGSPTKSSVDRALSSW